MIGTFARNTLNTFIVRVLTAVLSIIVEIVIARVLGPGRQGIYALAVLLPITLFTLTGFGINISSQFYIPKKKYSPAEVFGNDIAIIFLLSIFSVFIGSIIILFWGVKIFPGVGEGYLFLALSLIPFNFFFDIISSVLLGMQKITKYNIVSFLQSFIFLSLTVVLLLGLRLGVKASILAQIFSFVFSGIILFFVTLKETKTLILKLNKNYFKDSFVYGFKNYFGAALNFLHYRIDMFLINIFINPFAVGIYFVAVELAEGIWLVSQSTATVFFPAVSAETDEKKIKEFAPLVCRNVLFITFLIAVILFMVAHFFIVLLYSTKFIGAVKSFRILLIGTLFIAGWRILANDISARGKPMINTYFIGFSLVLNLILNIIFIPRWGINGAAYATAISYFVLFFGTVLIYAKISKNKIKDIIFLQAADIVFYKNFFVLTKKSNK